MAKRIRSSTEGFGSVSTVILVFLLSGSVFIHGFLSRILGLTMVCIVSGDYSMNITNNKTVEADLCGYEASGGISQDESEELGYHGTFHWSKLQQSNVIAAHNWAEFAWLPLSGFVIHTFNETQILGLATLLCIVVTALFPVAVTQWSWSGALAVRLVLGSGQAFSSPSLDQIVAKYVPKPAKSTAYSLITAGSQVAVFVGTPLGAYFCRSSFWGGWKAIFYVATIVAGGWLIVWEVFTMFHFFYHAEPPKPQTTGSETSELTAPSSPEDQETVSHTKTYMAHLKDFYENVVKEKAIYGLFPCGVAATWTVTLFIYYMPQFYRDVLRVSLKDNGYFSALPFLVQMLTKILVSVLADSIKARLPLSDSVVSKVFNTIGLVGSGICVFATVAVCMPPKGAVALVCVGYGLYSCTTPGFRTSLISINKDWTAVISACCTIFAMLGGIIFPYIFAGIVKTGAAHEYKILFGIMFAADIFAALCYIILGSTEGREEGKSARKEPAANHN